MATVTTATKTVNTSLLSLQSVAAAGTLISSVQTAGGALGALVTVKFGRRATTANTGQIVFRLEASAKSSGEGHWYVLTQWSTANATTAAESEALTGTVNSGQNVLTLASTTNLTAGDRIYIDNGTIANSEWGRIKSIVLNTSVTIEDNLVNAQTSSTIYDLAETWAVPIDLAVVSRWRLVVDGASGPSSQAFAIEAEYLTLDSYTNT